MGKWDKWQKSHIGAVLGAERGRKKYDIAKKVLLAAKMDPDYLVGIHKHSDIDSVRDILGDKEEWGVTRHLMSTILCENADPNDRDVIVEYNLTKRRQSEGRENISTDLFRVPFERFYLYLKEIDVEITDLLELPSDLAIKEFRDMVRDRQDLAMYVISEFEKCFTSLALGDWDMERELEAKCDEYWEIIPELLGELECFKLITGLVESNREREVTNRWFRIVRNQDWSNEEVRSRLLEIVSEATRKCERSDSQYGVDGYDVEYLLHGAIEALDSFPDDHSVSLVLESLLRLEENIFASSSLARQIHLSHGPLKSVLDDAIDAIEESGDDEGRIDKVAGVIDRLHRNRSVVQDVSAEVRGLFRDTLPLCSEENFRRLVEYASTAIFDGSNVDGLVEAVAMRVRGDTCKLTTDECLEEIRDSGIDLGFLIRALERIGGAHSRRYVKDLTSNLIADLDAMITGCINNGKANVTDEGDVSDWMRSPPNLRALLGNSGKFDEGISGIVSILEKNDHHNSEFSREINEALLRIYTDSLEGKSVVLEAVSRSEREVTSLRDSIIQDLEDWDSQCRMVKFSLAGASKQYLSERRVSSALLSVLRVELGRKADRQLRVEVGKALANSTHKEDLGELSEIIGRANRKEALIWSMVMAGNFASEFCDNVEESLSWGLDLNSYTTCEVLRLLAREDCSEETTAKVNGLIERPFGEGHGMVHGYIKCCALRVIARSKYDNPYPRLISMFKLGNMVEEIEKPIPAINAARESTLRWAAVPSYTVGGSLATPANFTRSLMFALSSYAMEDLLNNVEDEDPLVRYGCAATLASSYTNLSDHRKVRPVIMEMERKGLLSEYGLSLVW